MTLTLTVTENDQTIIGPCDLAGFVAPNDFIAALVEAARESGRADCQDADGCPVTAIITA